MAQNKICLHAEDKDDNLSTIRKILSSKVHLDECHECNKISSTALEEARKLIQTKDKCDKSIWMCITCGNLACSRRLNRHALEHYKNYGHNVNLNISTWKAWCYPCGQYVQDKLIDYIAHIKKIKNDDCSPQKISPKDIQERSKNGFEEVIKKTNKAKNLNGSIQSIPEKVITFTKEVSKSAKNCSPSKEIPKSVNSSSEETPKKARNSSEGLPRRSVGSLNLEIIVTAGANNSSKEIPKMARNSSEGLPRSRVTIRSLFRGHVVFYEASSYVLAGFLMLSSFFLEVGKLEPWVFWYVNSKRNEWQTYKEINIPK